MPASLKIKGPGLVKLQAVAKQLSERPHVKVGVLQNAQATTSTRTTKTASTSRSREQAPERKGKVTRARGNKSPGTTTTASSKTVNRGGGELTNAELMAIHEFGAPRAGIPSRSVLRATADRMRQTWLGMLERVVRGAVAGKIDLITALDLVGLKATADMVKTIRNGIPPPLKPATIAAKGSTKPLIDTSRLLQSIGHQVVRSSR